MDLIADILLAGGAFGVAIYCFVLSRRLTRFTDLERGVGGAVSVLSAQVDELTRALEQARRAADGSGETLRELTGRAEDVSRRLELHMASLHDLEPVAPPPEPAAAPTPAPAPASAPAYTPRARAPWPTTALAATPTTTPTPAPVAVRPAPVAAPPLTPPSAPSRLAGNPLEVVR